MGKLWWIALVFVLALGGCDGGPAADSSPQPRLVSLDVLGITSLQLAGPDGSTEVSPAGATSLAVSYSVKAGSLKPNISIGLQPTNTSEGIEVQTTTDRVVVLAKPTAGQEGKAVTVPLRLTEISTGNYADWIGQFQVQKRLASANTMLTSAGTTITLPTGTMVVSSNQLGQPVGMTVTMSEASAGQGTRYRVQFDRSVSGTGIKITLPSLAQSDEAVQTSGSSFGRSDRVRALATALPQCGDGAVRSVPYSAANSSMSGAGVSVSSDFAGEGLGTELMVGSGYFVFPNWRAKAKSILQAPGLIAIGATSASLVVGGKVTNDPALADLGYAVGNDEAGYVASQVKGFRLADNQVTLIDGIAHANLGDDSAYLDIQALPSYMLDVALLRQSAATNEFSGCNLANAFLSQYDWTKAEPVLFVHGFTPLSLGGGGGTWGKFPQLLQALSLSSRPDIHLVPFEFHWRTNQNFKQAASELTKVINQIHRSTGKKVHVVAHSFGGALTRLVLQNIAPDYPGSVLGSVAEARQAIAGVVTLGTPHSGILAQAGTVGLSWGQTQLPAGQDSWIFNACNQVSCRQMGAIVDYLDDFLPAIGIQGDDAVTGGLAAQLSATTSNLPAIPVYVGVGLSVEDGVAGNGDALISFGGQRFNAAQLQDTNSGLLRMASMGEAKVSEFILGFNDLVRPGGQAASNELVTKRLNGYVHASTTSAKNLFTIDGGVLQHRGLEAAPNYYCDMPATCTHAGWNLARQMLGDVSNLAMVERHMPTWIVPDDLVINPEKLALAKANDAATGERDLRAIADELIQKNYVSGQFPRWDRPTNEEMVHYNATLRRLLGIHPDWEQREADYNAQSEALSKFFDERLQANNVFITLDAESSAALYETLIHSGGALYQAVRIGVPLSTAKATNLLRKVPGPSPKLLKQAQVLGKAVQWVDLLKHCSLDTADAYNNMVLHLNQVALGSVETDPNVTFDGVNAAATCLLDVVGQMTDFASTESREKAIELLAAIAGATLDSGDVGQDGVPTFVGSVIVVTDVLDGLTALLPDSRGKEIINGAVRLVGEWFEIAKVSYQLQVHVGEVVSLRHDETIALYDRLAKRLLDERVRQSVAIHAQDLLVLKTPNIELTPSAPTVFQTVTLWLENAWGAAKQVVWEVAGYTQKLYARVVDGVSEAVTFVVTKASESLKVVAQLYDAAVDTLGSLGKLLGAVERQIVVSNGPTVTLLAENDNGATPVLIANNTVTDDATPRFHGQLSGEIPAGYQVRLFRGEEPDSFGTATVTGNTWVYAVPADKALAAGPHNFSAGIVLGADGSTPAGPRSVAVSFIVQATVVSGVSPQAVTRATPTELTFLGSGLAASNFTVTAPGSSRNLCTFNPQGATATAFKANCELYGIGAQALQVHQGSRLLGEVEVTVNSNVTDVNWAAGTATNFAKSTVRFGEMVTYQVTGTKLLADSSMGFAVDQCGASNVEVGNPSDTLRTFTCWFNSEAGAVAGQKTLVVKDAPGGLLLYTTQVPVEVAPIDASSITVSWDYGSVGTPVQGRGTNPRTVAITPGVEIEGFLNNAMMDVDVSNDRVRLFNFRSYAGAPGSAVFDASAFNGLVLRVPSGANWTFASASVGGANTLSGLTTNMLDAQAQRLAINLTGLRYDANTVVEVEFTLRTNALLPSLSDIAGVWYSRCGAGNPNDPNTVYGQSYLEYRVGGETAQVAELLAGGGTYSDSNCQSYLFGGVPDVYSVQLVESYYVESESVLKVKRTYRGIEVSKETLRIKGGDIYCASVNTEGNPSIGFPVENDLPFCYKRTQQ